MKYFLLRTRITLLLLAFFLAGCSNWLDFSPAIPPDPAVTVGKLDNGLTYYIRKNSKPENRAELRLVVNVGSLQEDDDQQGLAHFAEHMAFNGTRDFPKNELISYLQSIGMTFGADLNASTGFDETVYELSIPLDKPDNLEKGFRVMENWAAHVTFDTTEIENERGVVLEEARNGKGAQDRMLRKILPEIFLDSQYAKRLPIGDENLLKTFKPDALTRFYRDWYRPDLMAVVAVGDFDPTSVEALIRKYFANLQNPANPRQLKQASFGTRKEPKAIALTDREMTDRELFIFYGNHKRTQTRTEAAYKEDIIKSLCDSMLNDRLYELTQLPTPPFLQAATSDSDFARDQSFAVSFATFGETDPAIPMAALVRENEKVHRYGFTEQELDKTRREFLQAYENQYNEKDKQQSSTFVGKYANHFLGGTPMPSIDTTYNYAKRMLPTITLEEINDYAKRDSFSPEQALLVHSGPTDTDKPPSEAGLLTDFNAAYNQNITPYEASLAPTELMAHKPTPGSIIGIHIDKRVGYEELTLSNHVRVILKPTKFQNDEVELSGYRHGGSFLYPPEEKMNAKFASQVVAQMGIGEFSPINLSKILAGKTASLYTSVSPYAESVTGSSSTRDIETMLQLLYLSFTEPRRDPALFASYITRRKQQLESKLNDPATYFFDQQLKAEYPDHPFAPRILKPADFDKINLDRALGIYRERFSDAGGFVFTIVGNFNPATIKPLLETYIASLPATNGVAHYRDVGLRPAAGKQIEVYKGLEPKSEIQLSLEREAPYSPQLNLELAILSNIINIRIEETIREKLGLIYGAGFYASVTRMPYPHTTITLNMPCGPENVDKALATFWQEVDTIKQQGPNQEDLDKAKLAMAEQYKVSLESNFYWLINIQDAAYYGQDPSYWLELQKYINTVTAEDIRQVAIKYLDHKSVFQATLYPEKNP